MGKLSDVIDFRLKELGIPGSKMCDDLNMSRSTLTELRKGRATTLKAEKAAAIAAYLGLSVEELLGKEKAPTPEGERQPDINQAKIALFGGDGEVTDEMWEEAIFAAQLIKERHKRKKGN